MIDSHIHVVPPNLPGAGPLSSLLRGSVESVAAIVNEQMEASGTSVALAMGSLKGGDEDPLGIERTLQIAKYVPGLFAIGIADPERSDREYLRRVEEVIAAGKVIALKGYLGYVHRYPSDPGYLPYFRLAAKYRLPFIFHTGDTYSPYAKLKFAHPLGIDEVAVDHPDVSFVMAHVGNPWMLDAAEVVYKNVNVWVDLSGLFIGSTEFLTDPSQRPTHLDLIDRLQKAFRYAERPNRFLYGTDWPLAPMPVYHTLIREAFDETFHEQIFQDNARILFRIPETLLGGQS